MPSHALSPRSWVITLSAASEYFGLIELGYPMSILMASDYSSFDIAFYGRPTVAPPSSEP